MLPQWRAAFVVGVSCLFLSACATTAIHLKQESTAHLSKSHTILDVPYFPQTEDQCGPSSLATMLGVRGVSVSPQALRKQVYIPAKEGSLAIELVARARRHGMLVYPLMPNLLDVLTEIDGGNPVLVLQNLGFNWLPRWHFSVAIGYDLQKNTIILRSGKELEHEIDLQLFLKTWQRADNWAVVINKPNELPITAQESRFLTSANELEVVGETKAALEAYQAMSKRWPTNALAYFAAGNVAYELKRYQEASHFFSAYIEHSPKSAAGWNNLAYSLLERQCRDSAVVAISCALRLDPENSEVQSGYREIVSKGEQAGVCDMPKCPR